MTTTTQNNENVVQPVPLQLELRDWFAGQALSGDFAAQNELTGEFTNRVSDDTLLERAMLFYRMADAMIAARKIGAA